MRRIFNDWRQVDAKIQYDKITYSPPRGTAGVWERWLGESQSWSSKRDIDGFNIVVQKVLWLSNNEASRLEMGQIETSDTRICVSTFT